MAQKQKIERDYFLIKTSLCKLNKMEYKNFTDILIKESLLDIFSEIKIGIEKESMRVSESLISKAKHPKSLGAAISNQYITTDFSEAQLEMITPPVVGNLNVISILDNIHHFVTHNISKETLWPFSMPPVISSDDDIPIARYGTSHEGVFKHTYRAGLANRYGKSMQAISGLHFNYSLPEKIWDYFYYVFRNSIFY